MARASAFIMALVLFALPAFAANWLEHEDWAKAKELSKKTGRPMAVLFHEATATNRVHNTKVVEFKLNPALDPFICILVDMKKNLNFLTPVLQKTNDTRKEFIPMIFIITHEDEVLELLHYDSDEAQIKVTAEAVAKKAGPFLTEEKAEVVWKKLEDARKMLGENGKAGAAMKIYAELSVIEKANPNLPISKELKGDTDKINAKGRELIAQAKKMNTDGKTQDSLTFLRQLAAAFNGYDAGKEAVDLGKQIAATPAAPKPAAPVRRPPVVDDEEE